MEVMMDEILNVRETAEYTKLKLSTIYSYIRARKIPHFKVGTRCLFARQELEDWLNRHRIPIGG